MRTYVDLSPIHEGFFMKETFSLTPALISCDPSGIARDEGIVKHFVRNTRDEIFMCYIIKAANYPRNVYLAPNYS